MFEPTWILLMGAALAALSGLGWLALAMDGHWQQVHSSIAPSPWVRLTLRTLGITGILTSAVLCLMADRPSLAVLAWLMLMSVCAPLVAMTLGWQPQWLRVLWPLGGPKTQGA